MPRSAEPTTPADAANPCPVARSLDLIGDRWCLLIIRDAFDGIRRFGDFQRSLGVARNILADRLRRLVEAQVLLTRPTAEGSAYQEYVLSERGKRLFPLVVALRQWGEAHLFAAGEGHSQLLDRERQLPLAPLQPCDAQGRPLLAEQTYVRKLGEPD